jgi:hypothetical protein
MMKVQILDWKTYELLPAKEIDEILSRVLTEGNLSLVFVPYVNSFPLQQFKARWNEGSKANSSNP